MMFARLQTIPQQPGKKLIHAALCVSFLSLLCSLPSASAEETTGKGADPAKATECQATLALSYVQRNTIANVEGTIENTMCAASSGDYELAVSVSDGSGGDPKVLEFIEKWQRSDDQSIKFSANYPIGENVELLRVRSRKVHCTCTAAAPN
jgi:hypothetical protein